MGNLFEDLTPPVTQRPSDPGSILVGMNSIKRTVQGLCRVSAANRTLAVVDSAHHHHAWFDRKTGFFGSGNTVPVLCSGPTTVISQRRVGIEPVQLT